MVDFLEGPSTVLVPNARVSAAACQNADQENRPGRSKAKLSHSTIPEYRSELRWEKKVPLRMFWESVTSNCINFSHAFCNLLQVEISLSWSDPFEWTCRKYIGFTSRRLDLRFKAELLRNTVDFTWLYEVVLWTKIKPTVSPAKACLRLRWLRFITEKLQFDQSMSSTSFSMSSPAERMPKLAGDWPSDIFQLILSVVLSFRHLYIKVFE